MFDSTQFQSISTENSPPPSSEQSLWTPHGSHEELELSGSFDDRRSKQWNEPWCELIQNQFCQTIEELALSELSANANRKHNNSPIPGKRRRSSASDYFADEMEELTSKTGFSSIDDRSPRHHLDHSAQPTERLRQLICRSENADEFLKLLRRSLVREYCTGLRSLRNVRLLQPLVSEIDTQLYYETGRQAVMVAIDDALENQKDWLRELFHEVPSVPGCFKRFRSSACRADEAAEEEEDEDSTSAAAGQNADQLPPEVTCTFSWSSNSSKHCADHSPPDIVTYMDSLALGNRGDIARANFSLKEQISLTA